MKYAMMRDVPVFGDPDWGAVDQIQRCKEDADYAALCADHHLGYGVPIGGVVAYKDHITPTGVGFDIGCGNKAVRLDITEDDLDVEFAMDRIWKTFNFGVGGRTKKPVQSSLFDDGADPAWGISFVKTLKSLAEKQLGTIGSGNHYIDIFSDENKNVWIGVHFGSRGFGHKIATHYLKAAGGKDGFHVQPALIEAASDLGREYIAAMQLAGRYAMEGRDWVCKTAANLIGGQIVEEVHNHHNFAWRERHNGEDLWVVRKGATPAFPGQKGFIGGSMAENAVIIEGVDSPNAKLTLNSTVHGAGRVMSRKKAKAAFTRDMMLAWVRKAGVELRGGGIDESPDCYKRLDEVLTCHGDTINILHILKPLGVAMAGSRRGRS